MVKSLTAVGVRSLLAKGKPHAHADGGNLYLKVTAPGIGKWTFRYMIEGRAREMGLGPASLVSLVEARDAAQEARKRVRADLDPIEHRRAEAAGRIAAPARTFREVATLYIEAHERSWKNPKHAAQWPSSLEAYVYPVIGDIAVTAVDTDAVKGILDPIWGAKTETATRVRGRIEAVLDYAKALGWREGENPAQWRGHLAKLLPARSKLAPVEHHAALPWSQVGGLMSSLRSRDGIAALALRFCILTAARSGEIRGATWAEIDPGSGTWIIPAVRMKAGRQHRVPLSDAALEILLAVEPMKRAETDFIFPSPRKRHTPLSDMTLAAVLKRMGRSDLTVHGFRSTFRDWTAEMTAFPREVAEEALAHTIGDVEAAYRRGDMLDKRARLMAAWADYCGDVTPAAEVVPIRAAG